MSESFQKKEQTKKKAQKKQEKLKKMAERKNSQGKAKTLEDMMAYVDENGNITDTPPERPGLKEVKVEDILLGAAPIEPESAVRTGTVLFFDQQKGYGFISDSKNAEKIFVHTSGILHPIKEGNKVEFEKEKTSRGFSAVEVRVIK